LLNELRPRRDKQLQANFEPNTLRVKPVHQIESSLRIRKVERNDQPLFRLFVSINARGTLSAATRKSRIQPLWIWHIFMLMHTRFFPSRLRTPAIALSTKVVKGVS
jgi:hypothetical protein